MAGGSKKIRRGYACPQLQASSTQEERDADSLNAEETSTTTNAAALLGLQPALQQNDFKKMESRGSKVNFAKLSRPSLVKLLLHFDGLHF